MDGAPGRRRLPRSGLVTHREARILWLALDIDIIEWATRLACSVSFISRRDPAFGETVQMRDREPEVPTSMPVIAGG